MMTNRKIDGVSRMKATKIFIAKTKDYSIGYHF